MKEKDIEKWPKMPAKGGDIPDDLAIKGTSFPMADASSKSPTEHDEKAQQDIDNDWLIWPGNPS